MMFFSIALEASVLYKTKTKTQSKQTVLYIPVDILVQVAQAIGINI